MKLLKTMWKIILGLTNIYIILYAIFMFFATALWHYGYLFFPPPEIGDPRPIVYIMYNEGLIFPPLFVALIYAYRFNKHAILKWIYGLEIFAMIFIWIFTFVFVSELGHTVVLLPTLIAIVGFDYFIVSLIMKVIAKLKSKRLKKQG